MRRAKKTERKAESVESFASEDEDEDEETEDPGREETPDPYRHSVLGM